MSSKRKNVICAGTLVFRLNEVGEIDFLLVRNIKSPNRWGLPKGHLEENKESIEECAVRETWEESGVVARLLYELTPIFTVNKKENKTVYIFLAKQLNPQHGLKFDNKEIMEAKWFSMDRLPEIHSYQLTTINSAKNIIKKNMD